MDGCAGAIVEVAENGFVRDRMGKGCFGKIFNMTVILGSHAESDRCESVAFQGIIVRYFQIKKIKCIRS